VLNQAVIFATNHGSAAMSPKNRHTHPQTGSGPKRPATPRKPSVPAASKSRPAQRPRRAPQQPPSNPLHEPILDDELRAPRLAIGLLYLQHRRIRDKERTVAAMARLYLRMRKRMGPFAAWVFFHLMVLRTPPRLQQPRSRAKRWALLGIVGSAAATYLSPPLRALVREVLRHVWGQ
jgi:hypothetical protein